MGFCPESREPIPAPQASSTALGEPGPGPESRAPQSDECEDGDGYPNPEGFKSEREVLEAREPVLWGHEGQPGSLATVKGDGPATG